MGHPNEELLRDAYAMFGKGDIEGFLALCTDDIVFRIPGRHPLASDWNKDGFVTGFLRLFGEHTLGTFREDIVELVANDESGILLLDHHFEHGGKAFYLRAAHVISFRDGKIARWQEWPGDMAKFEEAWTP